MSKHITLRNTASGWVASFYGADNLPESEFVNLFGTHRIPTAFTAAASEMKVVDAVTRLNPGYTVEVQS